VKYLLYCFISLITLAVSGQEEQVKSLINKGIQYHDSQQYDLAIKEYQKALAIDPNSSLANYEIAFSYLSYKDYENAELHSKKVIDSNNGHVLEAYIAYGNALDLQGKSDKAIKAYENGIKDYDHYLLHFNHAMACFNAGKIDKAYNSAINAINNNSSHASSHLILSKIMDHKKSRIQAMLPLYFFLMIEPDSERAGIEYEILRKYLDQGVTKKDDKNIDVIVPFSDDTGFGAAEMMISMVKASENLEENKVKSDLELFALHNDKIFKMLGELKNDNTGIWWDFYVTFFYNLANENLTTPFSYYISLSQGDDSSKWLEENNQELERLAKWMQG